MERFRGGLAFKAHRLLYHYTLGSRVIKKKKKQGTPEAIWALKLNETTQYKWIVSLVQGYLASTCLGPP